VEDYFGINGMMDAEALARLMREAPAVNSVHLSFDGNALGRLYGAIKRIPAVSSMALQRTSLANFRDALAVIVTTMAGIYTLIEPMIPPAKHGGRRREVYVREVVNAIFYVLSTAANGLRCPRTCRRRARRTPTSCCGNGT
jgi:hypothetical protein